MKNFFIVFGLILASGCVPVIEDKDVFRTGKEVPPPWGCQELRKRGGEC